MAFHKLEKLCFPQDAWPIWDVFAALTLPSTVRLKAAHGEQFIGFVIGDRRPRQKISWIATFAVHPDYRGQGIGTALLERCEQMLNTPRVRLSVRMSNEPAIRLYKRYGYRVVGTWPRYYKGGEDALVMEKEIA